MGDQHRRAELADLGAAITPEMLQATIALYATSALRPDPAACEVRRDAAYGGDPRHRVDLFLPLARFTTVPIILFVHGGGFVGGDKGAHDAPFYNNVGAWAVGLGFIGATMTYRLAPGAKWPAGSQDVAAAVRWLRAHAASFGGDADRIVIIGQSAGAAHVAGYVAHPALGASDAIAGAVMLSGVYDLLTLAHSPLEGAYYGTDARMFGECSSLAGLASTAVPCLFSVSELDPASFQQQAARVVDAVVGMSGSWPRMLYLSGHNHLSPVLALGLADDPIGPEIGRFVRTVAALPNSTVQET